MKKFSLWLATALLPIAILAQNLGVNAPEPSQPLEVGGVIFTNQGGVMFPDSTLQTTAASTAAPYAQVDDRLYGILDFTDAPIMVDGPYDFGSGPGSYQDIFYVYDMGINVVAIFNAGSVGGAPPGTTPPALGDIRLLVDVGSGLPQLLQLIGDGDVIGEIQLDLFDINEVRYYRMNFRDAWLTGITQRIIHKGSGNYAHVAEVTIAPTIIEWEWFNDMGQVVQSACWNSQLNNSSCN